MVKGIEIAYIMLIKILRVIDQMPDVKKQNKTKTNKQTNKNQGNAFQGLCPLGSIFQTVSYSLPNS